VTCPLVARRRRMTGKEEGIKRGSKGRCREHVEE